MVPFMALTVMVPFMALTVMVPFINLIDCILSDYHDTNI
jgi:hypothetical protein